MNYVELCTGARCDRMRALRNQCGLIAEIHRDQDVGVMGH